MGIFKKKQLYEVKNCLQCPFSKCDIQEKYENIHCEILKDIVAEKVKYNEAFKRTTLLDKCPLKTTNIVVKRIPGKYVKYYHNDNQEAK